MDDPPRLADLGLAAAPALDVLLAALLAKDPSARPPDGAAVLAALTALTALTALSARAPASPPTTLTAAEQRIVPLVLTCPISATDTTLHHSESGEGLDEEELLQGAVHGIPVRCVELVEVKRRGTDPRHRQAVLSLPQLRAGLGGEDAQAEDLARGSREALHHDPAREDRVIEVGRDDAGPHPE